MKTTQAFAHVLDIDPSEKNLLEDIKSWVDSNMLIKDQKFVWRIGIATREDIVKVAGQVRSDVECKHFKHWRTKSFKEAIDTLTSLTKYPFIFKSNLNEYCGKGKYLFIYKAPCPSSTLFYHTLHY